MPTYEYQCVACGNRFERFQGIKDKPLTTCPRCAGTIRRLIGSGAGVLVKGGNKQACPLENTGKTCCGRDQRCGRSSCET
jgi:putative FmdB family regulatory protein